MKTTASNRFAETWFPLRDMNDHNIRGKKVYYETQAKTARYFNSPLAFMRRRANALTAA